MEARKYEKESSTFFKGVELDAAQIKWGRLAAKHMPAEAVMSEPPDGYHRIYGFYAKKVNKRCHIVMVIEDLPEPRLSGAAKRARVIEIPGG